MRFRSSKMYDFLIDDVEVDQTSEDKAAALPPWNILIVDDEQSIHDVTRFALDDVVFEGKALNFISALSGKQAKEILSQRDDIAIILLDVVMETDTEGLKVTRWIRNELKKPSYSDHPSHRPARTSPREAGDR